jgi:hypothetical protein
MIQALRAEGFGGIILATTAGCDSMPATALLNAGAKYVCGKYAVQRLILNCQDKLMNQ